MILLFAVTLVIGLGTSAFVRSRFAQYNAVLGPTGYSGADVAAQILRSQGIRDVTIEEGDGFLGDHYDPSNKKLVLSSGVYRGTSLSATGVAAHECGHAVQDQRNYAPLRWRIAAVGATTFASQVVTWLPFLGIVTNVLSGTTGFAIMAASWAVILCFNLITLPVEFDASNRARVLLSQLGQTPTSEDQIGVAKVLNAAALTYVGAAVSSLLYVLYYLLPLLNSRDRD